MALVKRNVTFDLPGRPSPSTPVTELAPSLNPERDVEAAKAILCDLRASDRRYVSDLSDLRSRLNPASEVFSTVDALRDLHMRLPDVVAHLPGWIHLAIPVYQRYIAAYSYRLHDSEQLAYLRKRPLSRLAYLAKTMSIIDNQHPGPIDSHLVRKLAQTAHLKLSDELDKADSHSFVFSKARSFDSLQPVSAHFNPAHIVQRDTFDVEIHHVTDKLARMPVEILLVREHDNTNLAICSFEHPGRALLFPTFRPGDIYFDPQASTTTGSLVLCSCDQPRTKRIILFTRDSDKLQSWKWKLTQLFASQSPLADSFSGRSMLGLGICYPTPPLQRPNDVLPMPRSLSSAELKRLSVPLTPSLTEQLKQYLTPELGGEEWEEPTEPSKAANTSVDSADLTFDTTASSIAAPLTPQTPNMLNTPIRTISDARLKRAQETRKRIERDLNRQEQELKFMYRDTEPLKLARRPVATPSPTPDRSNRKKPGLSIIIDNDMSSTDNSRPPAFPLPTPTSEKRTLSSDDLHTPTSADKRPLLWSSSNESSPVQEEDEAARAREMLRSRNLSAVPRVANSMYITSSTSDDSLDVILEDQVPRSHSDNDNRLASLPVIHEDDSAADRFGSPAIGDEDFVFRPKASTKMSTGTRGLVRKISGGFRSLIKKKVDKLEFDIINLTPPVDDGRFDSQPVQSVQPAVEAVAPQAPSYEMPSDMSTDFSDNSVVATAVCEESKNSTVEHGLSESISSRSFSRSIDSSIEPVAVSSADTSVEYTAAVSEVAVPDTPTDAGFTRKTSEGRIALYQGKAAISQWLEGSWVPITNNKEMYVEVSTSGEGGVVTAGSQAGSIVMEVNLFPSHEIRKSTVHQIQIKQSRRTTMFLISDIDEAEKFWVALQESRKDVKNQPQLKGGRSPHGPPSLNSRDSSLGSITSALVGDQGQPLTGMLRPPLLSPRNSVLTPPHSIERFSTPPILEEDEEPAENATELLLLNNLRCRFIQRDADGNWEEQGQLARLSVFSVQNATSKTILIRGPSNTLPALVYEKGLAGTAFRRFGKAGVAISMVPIPNQITYLLQLKGDKEARYVHELLTCE